MWVLIGILAGVLVLFSAIIITGSLFATKEEGPWDEETRGGDNS